MRSTYACYLIRHWTGVVAVATAATIIVGPVYFILDGTRKLARRLNEL